jgi:lipoprotein-anchoring transpeptidase ErfK/SrfK
MRRLVVVSSKVVSNKRSKAIAAAVATVLSLTSIHLAAAARIATLKRQQEQLEQASVRAAHTLLSQTSLSQTLLSQTLPSQNPLALTTKRQPEPQSSTTAGAQVANTTQSQQQRKTSALALPMPVTVRSRQIVISIADRQLAVLDNGQLLKIYPIAVGTRSTPSPDGDFVIINHAKDPTYHHADMEIAPGKDNPLGSRWMGLSMKGYGIHGTNVQSSVGKAASHGCFRMRTRDVEELYGLVQVGDIVTVRRERNEMIAQVFAAPAATLATTNVLSAKTQSGGDVQMASASETATVETSEQ